MKEKKSLQQLLLLKNLLKGKEVRLEQFSQENEISLRTAQRYMEELKTVFEGHIVKNCEAYIFVSSLIVEKNLLLYNKNELERVVDLLCLIEFNFTKNLDPVHTSVIEKLQKNYANCYSVKQTPFEDFLKNDNLKTIKTAIKQQRYVNVEYRSDKLYIFKELKIIKIIFHEGNFYLATLSDEEAVNNGFKFLRLSFIQKVDLLSRTFHKDIKAEFFIKNFQTLFSYYDAPLYEVIVEINSEVERFFKQKKFLSSQKIVQEKPILRLSFQISNEMEILPLVKKWIPHIKIISPQKIKNRLNEDLLNYMKSS